MSEMAPDDAEKTVAYEDGGDIVICDRKNPNAWIRSDTVVAPDEVERKQASPQ